VGSGYPFIGEPAGLIEEQEPVYVGHKLGLIDAEDAVVSSTALSGSFTELLAGAAKRQETQDTDDKGQKYFANRTTSHHFPFFQAQ
jgi:hypothetical protein